MSDPQGPILVPPDQVQTMGELDKEPVVSTHRGTRHGYVKFTDKEPPVYQEDPFLMREP